jgi:hypothetical protein
MDLSSPHKPRRTKTRLSTEREHPISVYVYLRFVCLLTLYLLSLVCLDISLPFTVIM